MNLRDRIKQWLKGDEPKSPLNRAARREAGQRRGWSKSSNAQKRKAPNRLKTHSAVRLGTFGSVFIPNERVEEFTAGAFRPIKVEEEK